MPRAMFNWRNKFLAFDSMAAVGGISLIPIEVDRCKWALTPDQSSCDSVELMYKLWNL